VRIALTSWLTRKQVTADTSVAHDLERRIEQANLAHMARHDRII
jgi:hypothetical protein